MLASLLSVLALTSAVSVAAAPSARECPPLPRLLPSSAARTSGPSRRGPFAADCCLLCLRADPFLLSLSLLVLRPVPAHPFLNIVARADAASELPGGATIPAACASTCSSTLTIYGYCLDADTKCLDICTDDGFDQFYSCVNCAFQYESFTASQYVQLQATASTLVCPTPLLFAWRPSPPFWSSR